MIPITSKIQRSGPVKNPIEKPSNYNAKRIIPIIKSKLSILTSFIYVELSIRQLRRQCHQQPSLSLKSAEASTTTSCSPGRKIGSPCPEHSFSCPPFFIPTSYFCAPSGKETFTVILIMCHKRDGGYL
jgi:hypothetical protein